MTAQVAPRPRVLADLVPGALVRDIALVIAAAVLTGIAAQISIPLPFTPVPISLQTFTVLLAGAALGPIRGAAGMLLYLGVGLAGVPWFSEQRSGWEFASFGYIVGFVLAAALVGLAGTPRPGSVDRGSGRDHGPRQPRDLRDRRCVAGELPRRRPADGPGVRRCGRS